MPPGRGVIVGISGCSGKVPLALFLTNALSSEQRLACALPGEPELYHLLVVGGSPPTLHSELKSPLRAPATRATHQRPSELWVACREYPRRDTEGQLPKRRLYILAMPTVDNPMRSGLVDANECFSRQSEIEDDEEAPWSHWLPGTGLAGDLASRLAAATESNWAGVKQPTPRIGRLAVFRGTDQARDLPPEPKDLADRLARRETSTENPYGAFVPLPHRITALGRLGPDRISPGELNDTDITIVLQAADEISRRLGKEPPRQLGRGPFYSRQSTANAYESIAHRLAKFARQSEIENDYGAFVPFLVGNLAGVTGSGFAADTTSVLETALDRDQREVADLSVAARRTLGTSALDSDKSSRHCSEPKVQLAQCLLSAEINDHRRLPAASAIAAANKARTKSDTGPGTLMYLGFSPKRTIRLLKPNASGNRSANSALGKPTIGRVSHLHNAPPPSLTRTAR